MKITTTDKFDFLLEEVFNPVILRASSGEEMSICMRDSGFEFSYQGIQYEAKDGIVRELKLNVFSNKDLEVFRDLVFFEMNYKFPASTKITEEYRSDNKIFLKFDVDQILTKLFTSDDISSFIKNFLHKTTPEDCLRVVPLAEASIYKNHIPFAVTIVSEPSILNSDTSDAFTSSEIDYDILCDKVIEVMRANLDCHIEEISVKNEEIFIEMDANIEFNHPWLTVSFLKQKIDEATGLNCTVLIENRMQAPEFKLNITFNEN